MKTLYKAACTIITGLFIASASVLAQSAPPAPASVSSLGEESIILPKTAPALNFYVEGTAICMIADMSSPSDLVDDGNQTFAGAAAAFGWRIDKRNKVQIEIGTLFSSNEYHIYEQGVRYKATEDYFALPILASYSFCIPLSKSEQWELRLTPTVGYEMMNIELKVDGVSVDDTQGSFVYGAGVGVTYHINKHMYVDAGYRFLRTGSTDYQFVDNAPITKVKFDGMNQHLITASFGWKF